MQLIPVLDKIMVKRDKEEKTSPGGIYLHVQPPKEKPARGKVIAVGAGKPIESGQIRKLCVNVDDTVYFGRYAGSEVKINDETYTMISEHDLLLIAREEVE